FAFDWRKGIDVAARGLMATMEALSAGNSAQRFTVVAHSMGALVTKRCAQLWPEAEQRIEQAIFVAPPLRGSFVPAQVFSGHHDLVRRFGLVSPGLASKITDVFRTFPALYQMLPDPKLFQCKPLYTPAQWPAGMISAAHLKGALDFGVALRKPAALMERT